MTMRFVLKLCLSGLLVACQPSGETGLQGQLLFADRPLAGASVEIYLKADKDRSVQPFAVSGTDQEGRYRLQLPPGQYFVIGKKRDTTPDGRPRMLMAECPVNPVVVDRGAAAVPPFTLHEMGRDGQLVAEPGTALRGRVVTDSGPVAGAFVYAYVDPSAELIGPSYGAVAETDAAGHYELPLPSGRYWLAARYRSDGARLGEPRPGDLNGRYPDNPVELARGKVLELSDLRVVSVAATTYSQRHQDGKFATTDTAFTGTIVDSDGQPVAGVYVFAYLDSRMVGKPTYISDPTGADGLFRLNLGAGGSYHLGARSTYGGPLEPGEWVGTYDGTAEHLAVIDHGTVRDLGRIEVREVW